jgi:hypothetical protein
VTLEEYLKKYLAFRKMGLCQEKENAINNQRCGLLFRQFTTIFKILHTEIRCENINKTVKTQNGSDVKLITMQS